jgi:uncharacterized protein
VSTTLIGAMALLGAIGGFLAGLLGFGGGVIMFPLLYYVPPLLGLERLSAHIVAAVVVSQVFCSALIGGLAHLRGGHVHRRIAVAAGITSALGSFAGGIASQWATERFLLWLFGIINLCVLLLMFLPGPQHDEGENSTEKVYVPAGPLIFLSLAAGAVIGFLGAGNFVFVALLIYVFKIPTRIAIGTTLFIALMNTATGFAGKLISGQIPPLAIAVIIGAGLGALAGEQAHRRVSASTLRIVYAIMVLLITIRVWLTLSGIAA